MKRRVGVAIAVALAVVVVAAGFQNRQLLRDRYIVETASQQPAAIRLGGELELTSKADFIYKASLPQLQTAENFNQSCKNVNQEQSIVLGCYTRQRLFVFNVVDSRLNGVKQVTAAHELLHAVYERLPNDEQQQQLNQQLIETAKTINDQRFKDTLAEYQRSEPDQIANELHSIIGTEIAVLPTRLEAHYQKYFKNRAKIVSYAAAYSETFRQTEDQIKAYDSQLSALRQSKTQLESQLKDWQRSIELLRSQLDGYQARGDTAAYNQAVPSFNVQVRVYNGTLEQLESVITQYNELVEKRNQLAATQNDLVQQLDSKYQPIQ